MSCAVVGEGAATCISDTLLRPTFGDTHAEVKRNTENKTSENLSDFQRSSSFRRFASLQNTWPKGPILCSICRQSSAICSRESKQFSFAEIEAATNNFSRENILGEGGFGYIYKGKLADGQLVAVKQHTEASKQGDAEFYSEVHFLSCAHHRNIVMLLGYCTEKEQSILVYEYICNKSLDWHLSDKNKNTLQWFERQAIAIGVAKGLRFLHEECRAGCIVHRDLKPSNILLTHDFNPMQIDFYYQNNGNVAEDLHSSTFMMQRRCGDHMATHKRHDAAANYDIKGMNMMLEWHGSSPGQQG
eukprot:Gb_14603 [translate_table: standard]